MRRHQHKVASIDNTTVNITTIDSRPLPSHDLKKLPMQKALCLTLNKHFFTPVYGIGSEKNEAQVTENWQIWQDWTQDSILLRSSRDEIQENRDGLSPCCKHTLKWNQLFYVTFHKNSTHTLVSTIGLVIFLRRKIIILPGKESLSPRCCGFDCFLLDIFI